MLGSGTLLPQRVLLQEVLCGIVSIPTPLPFGPDLGDGGYPALMELRSKHAKAFAKQFGTRGEVAVLCFLAVLSGRVREPPASRQRGFWNKPRESLPPTFREYAPIL